jgi:phospholipase A-2-activating protein
VSVWAVKALDNGDFAVGGSDGVVRVFTKEKQRMAEKELLQAFEESIASQAIPL